MSDRWPSSIKHSLIVHLRNCKFLNPNGRAPPGAGSEWCIELSGLGLAPRAPPTTVHCELPSPFHPKCRGEIYGVILKRRSLHKISRLDQWITVRLVWFDEASTCRHGVQRFRLGPEVGELMLDRMRPCRRNRHWNVTQRSYQTVRAWLQQSTERIMELYGRTPEFKNHHVIVDPTNT